jgi:hypothetical protein
LKQSIEVLKRMISLQLITSSNSIFIMRESLYIDKDNIKKVQYKETHNFLKDRIKQIKLRKKELHGLSSKDKVQ